MSIILGDTKLIERLAHEPDLAKTNLRTIFTCFDQGDESLLNWVTEALENCGAPMDEDVEWLSDELNSKNSDVAYWASTLLGRAGKAASASLKRLASLVASDQSDANVRARAAWAIGRIGIETPESKASLELAAHSDSPRLVGIAQESLALLR